MEAAYLDLETLQVLPVLSPLAVQIELWRIRDTARRSSVRRYLREFRAEYAAGNHDEWKDVIKELSIELRSLNWAIDRYERGRVVERDGEEVFYVPARPAKEKRR